MRRLIREAKDANGRCDCDNCPDADDCPDYTPGGRDACESAPPRTTVECMYELLQKLTQFDD